MESDSWSSRFAAASKRLRGRSFRQMPPPHHPPPPPPPPPSFEVLLGFEDEGDCGDDDEYDEFDESPGAATNFFCPFCGEDFDVVSLCCHIDDQHSVEVKNGSCPICTDGVGLDLIGHITTQHAELLKLPCGRKNRRGSSSSTSLARKDLIWEAHLQSIWDQPHRAVAANTTADPLLSSFISNINAVYSVQDMQSESSGGKSSELPTLEEKTISSTALVVPDEKHEERALRSQFVQDLVMSTIFKGEF